MDSEELLIKIRELEMAAAQKSWPLWAKVAVVVLVLALIGTAAAAAYHWTHREKAQVMTELQIKQAAELAKRLDISQAQATRLAAELAKASNKDPEIRYIVQAPTVEKAADQVRKDIDAGKSPANMIPADRTVVTPNVKEQKVDVYRITLDKAKFGVNVLILAGGTDPIEVGAGPSYKNKDWAANAGGTSRGRFYLMGTRYF